MSISLPVIAIVGRPNVGKSTLFNALTGSRAALVADQPGLTRDRQYGRGKLGERAYIVIDTGGLSEETEGVELVMASQSRLAICEADIILFMVDSRAGITPDDQMLANELRRMNRDKKITLVANKIDTQDPDVVLGDFYRFGIGEPFPIAAVQRLGVTQLIEHVLQDITAHEFIESQMDHGVQIAIVGRPNVGKSTLVNCILGEERVVVFDEPGTTRDSIFIPFERRGKKYTVIDTAGLRRRGKITETVEKFSVIKALDAITQANVVIFVCDAREGVVEHELHLLSFVLESGKSLVIAINKWDGLSFEEKEDVQNELKRRLHFVSFAKLHFISAKNGTGIGALFRSVDEAYASAMQKFSTPMLTQLMQKAALQHQPPMVHGRRVKLRYAHTGGHNPPIIVIHGTQVEALPESYQRFLTNFFREELALVGTPIEFVFKNSENPFTGRHNTLTPRQMDKRKRLMKHIKGKK